MKKLTVLSLEQALSLPYDPSRIEPERYAFWERLGFVVRSVNTSRRP